MWTTGPGSTSRRGSTATTPGSLARLITSPQQARRANNGGSQYKTVRRSRNSRRVMGLLPWVHWRLYLGVDEER
jgi:hypothetical protein